MSEKPKPVVTVPDDFSYLDPSRPAVVYEATMTDDEKQRFAVEMEATRARAAKSSCRPPWTAYLADGTTVTVGVNAEEPVVVPPPAQAT